MPLKPTSIPPSNSAETSARRLSVATRRVVSWFSQLNRQPFAFQREAWRNYLQGRNGLIYAQTGTGKTLAAFLGPVIEHLAQSADQPAAVQTKPSEKARTKSRAKRGVSRLQVLWITPLRALAGDTEASLRDALNGLGVDWSVEKRTSDVSASTRARQSVSLPEVLVTTPESVTLQLTRDDCAERFSNLKLIVVDEWHELLGTKRGVQTELALSRLRALQPAARVWGLSATMAISIRLWQR